MTLAEIRQYALALAGATEEPHFDRTSFRVNGKIFITARPTESHIHVFVAEEVRELALKMHPGFVSKLLWGGKVVGLRVALPKADGGVVRDLVASAWRCKAAKTSNSVRPGSRL